MQNRALQTRAQPTPSVRCTRAVCGVSSKQNPLHRRTPYDPENKHLCPIQARGVLCPSPSLQYFQTRPLGAGRGVRIDRLT
jgi:hypothetical protein